MTTKLWEFNHPNPNGRLHKLWHRATNYRYLSRWKHGREWRARAAKAWEARLPARRSKEGLDATTIKASDANPQLRSLFFCRLPLEIRTQIYVEILGHDEFLFRITNEDTSMYEHELGKEEFPFELLCHGAQGFLSFTISCKLAYMESHNLLYTSNTFRFAGLTEYACLTRLVARQNLDLIRNLHVQWSYEAAEAERNFLHGVPPYEVGFWAETWKAISECKGLKHVRVDIHKWNPNYRILAYQEEYYLAPLKLLGDHVRLEVCLAWAKLEGHGGYVQPPDAEKWPFVIRRNLRYCEDGAGGFTLESRE